MHVRRWMVVLILVGLVIGSFPKATYAKESCFGDKTPYCLNEPFTSYWETNGGLPVFGYPVTERGPEINVDTGDIYQTQWMERNRMEVHPENAGTPYEILLGLLGKDRLAQLERDWQSEPQESGPKAGCLWFEQTGHNVCNQGGNLGFKTYWETHGLKIPGLDNYARSLQLFGLPLTEPKMETNSSGDTVLTQWFERARFEWHPNNPNEYKVLLGLLGKEVSEGNKEAVPTGLLVLTNLQVFQHPSGMYYVTGDIYNGTNSNYMNIHIQLSAIGKNGNELTSAEYMHFDVIPAFTSAPFLVSLDQAVPFNSQFSSHVTGEQTITYPIDNLTILSLQQDDSVNQGLAQRFHGQVRNDTGMNLLDITVKVTCRLNDGKIWMIMQDKIDLDITPNAVKDFKVSSTEWYNGLKCTASAIGH